MSWSVRVTKGVQKQARKLPGAVQAQFAALLADLETHGPTQPRWKNYGKLTGNLHHCHLRKGRPTYVAVWEAKDKTIRIIEVRYVGTHENAPY